MPEYKVNWPVKLAGKIIKAGTVDCAVDVAKPLLKSGGLAPIDGATDSAISTNLAEFTAAITRLDPANPAHWIRDGQPDLKALEEVGLRISGKERAALWAEYQAANPPTGAGE